MHSFNASDLDIPDIFVFQKLDGKAF